MNILRVRLGRSIYRPYDTPTFGYLASICLFGWCIGFVRDDGSLQVSW